MRSIAILALIIGSSALFAGDLDVKAIDTNADGVIQKEEVAAIEDADVKAAVVALDADKNGEVSAEELAAKPAAK